MNSATSSSSSASSNSHDGRTFVDLDEISNSEEERSKLTSTSHHQYKTALHNATNFPSLTSTSINTHASDFLSNPISIGIQGGGTALLTEKAISSLFSEQSSATEGIVWGCMAFAWLFFISSCYLAVRTSRETDQRIRSLEQEVSQQSASGPIEPIHQASTREAESFELDNLELPATPDMKSYLDAIWTTFLTLTPSESRMDHMRQLLEFIETTVANMAGEISELQEGSRTLPNTGSEARDAVLGWTNPTGSGTAEHSQEITTPTILQQNISSPSTPQGSSVTPTTISDRPLTPDDMHFPPGSETPKKILAAQSRGLGNVSPVPFRGFGEPSTTTNTTAPEPNRQEDGIQRLQDQTRTLDAPGAGTNNVVGLGTYNVDIYPGGIHHITRNAQGEQVHNHVRDTSQPRLFNPFLSGNSSSESS